MCAFHVSSAHFCGSNMTMEYLTKCGYSRGPWVYWIVIFYAHIHTIHCHECSVLVYFGLKTARCDRLNLAEIPQDLGHDIKVLSFEHNNLGVLEMDQFSIYPNLQEIYIIRNHIDHIHR